jgi:lipoprotein-releasing system permease protein
MRYETFIACRYLRARRKQAFISVITVISILGITVGVVALVIALALGAGFATDIRAKILGAEAQLFVFRGGRDRTIEDIDGVSKKMLAVKGVVAVAPNIRDQGLVEGPLRVLPVYFRGIIPTKELEVADLADKLSSGSLFSLSEHRATGSIILGYELAYGVGAYVGDSVRLISPSGRLSPFGLMPRMKTFKVTGLLNTGMYEYDYTWALISLSDAQSLLNMPHAATMITARVADLDDVASVTRAVQEALGDDYYVKNIIDMNRSLFSALKLEKLMMFITISLIVLVAALNIVSTLILMVIEKNKDIGILMAMGATTRSILWIFMLQGLIIGVIGTGMGCLLGFSTCWILDTYKMISLNKDVYFIDYLPFRVEPLDFAVTAFLAVLISFAATLYPAYRASRLDPGEALRYE